MLQVEIDEVTVRQELVEVELDPSLLLYVKRDRNKPNNLNNGNNTNNLINTNNLNNTNNLTNTSTSIDSPNNCNRLINSYNLENINNLDKNNFLNNTDNTILNSVLTANKSNEENQSNCITDNDKTPSDNIIDKERTITKALRRVKHVPRESRKKLLISKTKECSLLEKESDIENKETNNVSDVTLNCRPKRHKVNNVG